MSIDVRVSDDGALEFVTEAQQPVVRLSPYAVTVLHNLARVPAQNRVVRRHVQRLALLQPGVIRETERLELTALQDDGTLQLTAAGQRLITWLTDEWAGWKVYVRALHGLVATAWGWTITHRAA